MNKLQLAIQYYNSGNAVEAENTVCAVLDEEPDNVVACHLLGTIRLRSSRIESAIEHLAKAIALAPQYADAYRDLAAAYGAAGQLDRSVATYRQLLAIKPDDAMACHNLGNAYVRMGQFDTAKDVFFRAVELNPRFAGSACDLATTLHEVGEVNESITWYRKAIALEPRLEIAYAGLARSLAFNNDSNEALRMLCLALEKLPDSFILRRSLSESIEGIALPADGERERRILIGLLEDPNISSQGVAVAVASMIENSAAFERVRQAVIRDNNVSAALAQTAFFEDSLLVAALPKLLFQSLDMEQVLGAIRREHLLSAQPHVPMDFACALARHCFLAEYVWRVSEAEDQRLAAIAGAVDELLQAGNPDQDDLEMQLVKLALYRPLSGVLSASVGLERLARMRWSPAFDAVYQAQVRDILQEQELAAGIPSISEIADDISAAVKQQYEHNPYPRWMDCRYPAAETFSALVARWRPGQSLPGTPNPLRVLDAGCGTGHSPVQAARMYPGSEVTAVDISRASLGYAARKAEQYAVTNLAFHCGDILSLGALKERFQLIICGGVLHHLQDPLSGWQVLSGLLAEGGLMKIALYSTRARAGVAAARELFADLPHNGITLDKIRECRQMILDLPEEHPARSVVYSPDFRSASGFRDLVLHTMEHTYTLPDINRMLTALGLRFLGFELTPEVLGAFKRLHPGSDSERNLDLWDRFEQLHPEVFAGMYQFWCSR